MTQELEIECGDFDGYTVFIQVRDDSVFAEAKNHPAVQRKRGEDLVAVLLQTVLPPEGVLSVSRKNKNERLNDGPEGQPAYQRFNPQKAVARTQWNDGDLKARHKLSVVEETHYKDGKLNDAADGTAAFQRFSETTGKLTNKLHYKDDLLSNAADGEAARQEFDDKGELIYNDYRIDGKWNDGPNGEPAAWKVDSKTGDIMIWHCTDGKDNDLPDGTPAFQRFTNMGVLLSVIYMKDDKVDDASDGTPGKLLFAAGELSKAWRYKDGKETKELGRLAKRKLRKSATVQALKKLHP